MRGVAAQYRGNYCSLHLNNLLISDTQTYLVPPSVNPSTQDLQHLDNGTVQEWTISHLGNPTGEYLQTSNLLLCPLILLSSRP